MRYHCNAIIGQQSASQTPQTGLVLNNKKSQREDIHRALLEGASKGKELLTTKAEKNQIETMVSYAAQSSQKTFVDIKTDPRRKLKKAIARSSHE